MSGSSAGTVAVSILATVKRDGVEAISEVPSDLRAEAKVDIFRAVNVVAVRDNDARSRASDFGRNGVGHAALQASVVDGGNGLTDAAGRRSYRLLVILSHKNHRSLRKTSKSFAKKMFGLLRRSWRYSESPLHWADVLVSEPLPQGSCKPPDLAAAGMKLEKSARKSRATTELSASQETSSPLIQGKGQ